MFSKKAVCRSKSDLTFMVSPYVSKHKNFEFFRSLFFDFSKKLKVSKK